MSARKRSGYGVKHWDRSQTCVKCRGMMHYVKRNDRWICHTCGHWVSDYEYRKAVVDAPR